MLYKLSFFLKYIIPYQIYQNLRGWAYYKFVIKDFSYAQKYKILNTKRYKEINLQFRGFPLKIVDGQSFLFMYNELFNEEVYKFQSNNKSPYIIDCGANIGLSIIYLKSIYPDSRILAFEPDLKIFNVLTENIDSSKLTNIKLVNKALSKTADILFFHSEGSDAGRIAIKEDCKDNLTIEGVQLSNFIDEEIDFLKIDIEGAETDVIEEIENKLHFVNNIFVEYHSFINKPFTLDKILSILNNVGFKLYITAPGISSKNPFISRPNKYGMDMQLNIYGYRLNKNASK